MTSWMQEQMAIGQAIYGQQGGAPGPDAGAGGSGSQAGGKDPNVVDAEFTDSSDNK